MNAAQSNHNNGKTYARQLIARAVEAEKEADAARKLARLAKAKHRAARKAFKKAKERAKQARKDAKVAARLFGSLARRGSERTGKVRNPVRVGARRSKTAQSVPSKTARRSVSKPRRHLVSASLVAPGVNAPTDNVTPAQE
jgi:hypothetical protein